MTASATSNAQFFKWQSDGFFAELWFPYQGKVYFNWATSSGSSYDNLNGFVDGT